MLRLLSFVIGYRFHNSLYPHLSLPYKQAGLDAKEIREKARASSAVAGIFMALLVGLLAILAAAGPGVIDILKTANREIILLAVLGALLPYLSLREERCISAAEWEARAWQTANGKTDDQQKQKKKNLQTLYYLRLLVWLGGYVALFFTGQLRLLLGRAFPLSGLFLVGISLILLVFSVELYDSAGSWQKLNNVEFHFHMASIASHCYLLGLSTTLIGFSLLLCLGRFRSGYWLSVVVLVALLVMTEIERELNSLA